MQLGPKVRVHSLNRMTIIQEEITISENRSMILECLT